MKQSGISYVALRPGAFLDQTPSQDYLGDSIRKGSSFAVSVWDKNVPIGMIYTKDLADYFVKSIDIPTTTNDEKQQLSIDVGWTTPIDYIDVVNIINKKLNNRKNMKVYGLPQWFRTTLVYTIGCFSKLNSDMFRMFSWFGKGEYISTDNTHHLQLQYFGPIPTPDDAIERWLNEKVLNTTATTTTETETEEK